VCGFVRAGVIKIMIAFRRAASMILRSNVKPINYAFSKDTWKERDDAAEKVFITQQERRYGMIQVIPSRSCSRKWRKTRKNGMRTVECSRVR